MRLVETIYVKDLNLLPYQASCKVCNFKSGFFQYRDTARDAAIRHLRQYPSHDAVDVMERTFTDFTDDEQPSSSNG